MSRIEEPGSGERSHQGTGIPQATPSSGQGSASAFARMKSQHEHRAQQRPAEDPSPDRLNDEP